MEATSPPTPPTPRGEPFPVGDGVLAGHVRAWFDAWQPRQRLSLPEWSAEHARLEDGRAYRAFPFQRDIAAAFTQLGVRQITVMKSARVGYSKIIQNFIGYSIAQHPRKVLIYQPTIDDAEKYSRDDIEPVLQWRAVREKAVFKPRHSDNQTRAKRFPGGWLQIKGMNSAKEFRRVSADVVIIEEPSGAPPTAGISGDQSKLAFMRCFTSDDPLKVAGGTPLVAGSDRTEALFLEGTQEHRYVPCPHCGHRQVLVFGDGTGPGIRFEPREKPTRAWYRCAGEKACDIDEEWKSWMDERGEFVPHAPENGRSHRSFHIWAAYSQFPEASWLNIAREFLASRKDPTKLQPFTNEWLGETWRLKGEAPTWRRLYDRREERRKGLVPRDALLLLGGIDVQGNRIEIFVWGWSSDRQSYLVDHHVVVGNPVLPATWDEVSRFVTGEWDREGGGSMKLAKVGADTGYQQTHVLAWARKHPGLVVPVKGASSHQAPVFAWGEARDPGPRGGKRKKGQRLGLVGNTVVTTELYGLLNLDPPTREEAEVGVCHPPGYVHLSDLATEEFCKQLVGVEWIEKTGQWKDVHVHEALDGWKYARAMFTAIGADRWSAAHWRELRASWDAVADPEPAPAVPETALAPPPQAARQRRVGRSSYLSRINR
ncbi:terminase gpA endonuclease subunit [Pararoseomonas sp. SCSIO 73927]|uniref:terminase gpA endonuclease subunit n=1 Tax=Pararoseomonas sp. SCSIO 73927 TaxID=3114537 RepID=UPI0030D61B11